MKIVITGLFLISTLSTICMAKKADGEDPDDLDDAFKKFMKDYKKEYRGKQLEEKKAIFEENQRQVRRQNQEGGSKCKFKINKFGDWSPAQKKAYLSDQDYEDNEVEEVQRINQELENRDKEKRAIRRRVQNRRNLQTGSTSNWLPFLNVPNSYDWRTFGKVSVPKDQGACGSCFSFGAISHLQASLAVHENRILDLSEQWGLQCGGGSCSGGNARNIILKVLNNEPMKLESQYSYKSTDTSSYYADSQICSTTPSQVKFNSKVPVGVISYKYPTDELMRRILIRNGPFTASLNADYMFNYDSGVFEGCKDKSVSANHAITIVGFDADGNWIMKNSWGEDWGTDGYMILSKDYNCGLTRVLEFEFEEQEEIINTVGMAQLNYKIDMTDSYGDGWNGNVIICKQNGISVGEFGAQFISGKTYPSVYFLVFEDLELECSVKQLGGWSYEVGFKIYNQNNQIVAERASGKSFSAVGEVVAYTFPPSTPTVTYYIQLLSNNTNRGYGGCEVGFKQDGKFVATFGSQLTSGTSSGLIPVKLMQGYQTHFKLHKWGSIYTSEIGVIIRDSNNQVIFEWQPGNTYLFMEYVYHVFCAGC